MIKPSQDFPPLQPYEEYSAGRKNIPAPPPPSQQVGEWFPGPESFEDFKMFAIAFIGGLLGAIAGVLIGWSLS